MELRIDATAARRPVTALPPGSLPLLAAFGVLTALLLVFALQATGGVLGYSLDDAYIHLALAQRLLHLHYGLNATEVAAPSSSIVYPVLLAGLLALGVGQAAPLVLNLLATGATAVLLAALAEEAGIDLARIGAARVFVTGLVIALSLNLVGLAFTGLEHALHVADTLACLLGMMRALRTRRVPAWLPVVLVLNPLIRFEGLSIWGAGLLVLALDGQRKAALLTLLAGVVLVGGFCTALHLAGLPFLPSSVLAKSTTVGATGLIGSVKALLHTAQTNLTTYGAPQLVLTLGLMALALGRGDRVARGIALFAGLPVLAHLAAGAFGWFGRYEIYILALGWAAAMVLHAPVVARVLSGAPAALGGFLLVFLGLHASYAETTRRTPAATAEIRLQQYQMHRFATDVWRAPVAVNDLGWVAYDNPNYVLDLWGLGSEAARTARMRGGSDPSWMDDLARRHGVDLAMIYAPWFPILPADWTPVATLTLARFPSAAAWPTVTFYATRPDAIPMLRAALARFAPSLPTGVSLAFK